MLDADTKAPAPTGFGTAAPTGRLTQERIVESGAGLRLTTQELKAAWETGRRLDIENAPEHMASLLCMIDGAPVLCRYGGKTRSGDVVLLLPPNKKLLDGRGFRADVLRPDNGSCRLVPSADVPAKVRVLPGNVPDLHWTALTPRRGIFHGHAVRIDSHTPQHLYYDTCTLTQTHVNLSRSVLDATTGTRREAGSIPLAELYVDPSMLASRGSRQEWEEACGDRRGAVPLSIAGVVARGQIDPRPERASLLVHSSGDPRTDAVLSRYASNKDVSDHFRIPLDADTRDRAAVPLQSITWSQLHAMSRQVDSSAGISRPYVWLSSAHYPGASLRVAIRCSALDSSVDLLVNRNVLARLGKQIIPPRSTNQRMTYAEIQEQALLSWATLSQQQAASYGIQFHVDQECDIPIAPSHRTLDVKDGKAGKSRLLHAVDETHVVAPVDLSGVIAEYAYPQALKVQYEQGESLPVKGLPFGHPVIFRARPLVGEPEPLRALYLGEQTVNGVRTFSLLIHLTPPTSELPSRPTPEWALRHDVSQDEARWLPVHNLDESDPLLLRGITGQHIDTSVIVQTDGTTPQFREAVVAYLDDSHMSFGLRYEDGKQGSLETGISRMWLDPRQARAGQFEEASASMRSGGKHRSLPAATVPKSESSAPASTPTFSSTSFSSTHFSSTTRSTTTRTASNGIAQSSPSSTTVTPTTRSDLPQQLRDSTRLAPLHSSQDMPTPEALLPLDGKMSTTETRIGASMLNELNNIQKTRTDFRVYLERLGRSSGFDEKGTPTLPEDLPDPFRFHPPGDLSEGGEDIDGFVHLSVPSDADPMTLATVHSMSSRQGDSSTEGGPRLHFYINAAQPDDWS
jgi:hypothetical protein